MRHDRLQVEAAVVVQRAIRFCDSDQHSTALLQELRRMVPHVAEPLHDESFPFEPWREADRLHVLGTIARFAYAEIHAAPGRFSAATNAALRERFRGDAGHGVDVADGELRVGVGDPGHFLAGRAVVRRRDIDAGSDKILFPELECVAPRDPFEFGITELLAIDLDPAFCATERHVHHRAFVRHQ